MTAAVKPADMLSPLTRSDGVLAVLVGLAGLALYARTLATFVLPHDSGELQVLVHQLGTTHTTGYSTYLILGNIFTRLVPIGEMAYRVNLFSAVMGALTLALVYLAGRQVSGSRSAGVFAALALGIGYTFWSQAIIAEVYTTGAAFLAVVLVLTIVWYVSGRRWPIFTAALLGGVGLGAHGSLAIFGIAVGIFLLLNWRRWREWLAPSIIGTALGLALYVGGTFLIDANNAPANIFRVSHAPNRSHLGLTQADVTNPFSRVWFVISAGNWRAAMFANPLHDTPRWLLEYLRNLPRDIFFPTLALAIFGLVRLIRRDQRLAALLFVALCLQLMFYLNYDVGRARFVFYIPSYLLWVLLATIGFADLVSIIASQPWGGRSVRVMAVVVISAVCLAPLVWPQRDAILEGQVAFMRVEDSLVHSTTADLGKAAYLATAALPDNAIVFADWYRIWPYCYAAHIEQGRTGIRFVNIYPYSDQLGIALSMVDFVRQNITRRPIYFADRYGEFAHSDFSLRPVQMGATQMWQVQPRVP